MFLPQENMRLKNFIAEKYLLIILMGLFLIFSLPTISRYLINWDAGQFALGTIKYDLHSHQPQPPGYPLFILSGKLLNYIFHNINYAFIALNFIAGLLVIYFLFKLIKAISQSQATSFGVTLLFLFNPIFWYYHNTALTYTFEALAVTWLSYLTYLTIISKQSKLLPSLIITVILMGFRPSIIVVALPILIIQFIYTPDKLKNTAISLGLSAILFLAWFIPFVQIIGGFNNLSSLLFGQFTSATALKHGSLLNKPQIIFFLESLILGFNLGFILALICLPKNFKFLKEKKLGWLFIAPLLVSIFYICSHFGEVGYTLSILPILYLLIIYPLNKLSLTTWGKIIIIFIACLEILIFFKLPPIFHTKKVNDINYQIIQGHDQRLQKYLTTVKQYKPEELLLIALRGQYYDSQKNVKSYAYDDIRILSYYLPTYQIYDLMGVQDFYSLVNNYSTTDIHNNQINFSPSKNKILILADYLHPDIYPTETKLTAKFTNNSPFNYYEANVSGLDQFRFYGFNWIKQ